MYWIKFVNAFTVNNLDNLLTVDEVLPLRLRVEGYSSKYSLTYWDNGDANKVG